MFQACPMRAGFFLAIHKVGVYYEFMPLLSLVVPCYNEQEVLHLFMEELTRVAATLGDVQTEVILVNDGSSDNTLAVIRELAGRYDCVRYISFSRNFGKESAMLAGFAAAKGDYVAVMDADLQDPPALLPDMLRAVREEGLTAPVPAESPARGSLPSVPSLLACFTDSSI